MTMIQSSPNEKYSDPMLVDDIQTTKRCSKRTKRLKESVNQVTSRAKKKTTGIIDDGTTKLGVSLGRLSEASDGARKKLDSGYQTKLSPAMHKVSEKLASTSQYLQQSKPSDLAEDVYSKSKANPRTTAAILVGAGFLLGRLLRSKS
ncbi:hypothetical protein ACFPK9_15090 [Rubritalea spongiae]|uniref:DUF883 domain-containing protein n=1 Tax=Rubritalea spongiae TaxID=430797 RepID=A0ABW5DXC5_9BACT